MKKHTLLLAALCASSMSGAQSLNIDFNYPGVGFVPTSTYAAAGLPGVWNGASVPSGTISNMPLVDLGGFGTGALLNVVGFGPNWSNTGPWTGDDALLMEDLIGSGSNALQINFSGLLNGNYDVILYGQNSSGNSNSAFTINNLTQTTGGVWPGSHVAGASYTKFTNVSVVSGTLAINFTGNNNGIQLEYSPVPEPATIFGLLSGVAAILARRTKCKS